MPPLPAQSVTDSAAQQAFAENVLQAEVQAVAGLRIEPAFHEAVQRILQVGDAGGALVISGLGKNGPVGQKLSATFASTGTPSHFLHPTEAMHGDLGRIRPQDAVMLLSFGGQTEEVVSLAAILRQDGVSTFALTAQPDSELARLTELALCLGSITEACPHNLAPTASTTAMMALGDALALTVAWRRQFGVEDFKRFHPGGQLGRQLLPVTHAMRFKAGENLPLIPPDATLAEAYEMAEHYEARTGLRRAGAMLVVDAKGRLAGIFTDGDLRRLVGHGVHDALGQRLSDVATSSPRTLRDTALIREAVHLVQAHRIDEIPVVNADDKPLGLLDVQDLLAMKVIAS